MRMRTKHVDSIRLKLVPTIVVIAKQVRVYQELNNDKRRIFAHTLPALLHVSCGARRRTSE